MFNQPFQFEVHMPDFGGFLWVDYLDSDRNASHYEITVDGHPALFHKNNEIVPLGRRMQDGKYPFMVQSGAYGRDILVALVAAEPLPGSALPDQEAGEFYVT